MRSLRAMTFVAALGVALVLTPGGRCEEAEKPATLDEAGEAVRDIATANNLIEYGRKHKDPSAIIVGVRMLHTIGAAPEKLTAEGASKEEVPSQKDQFLKILDEAAAMKGGDGVDKMLAAAKDLVQEGAKGTRNKGTSWEGIINGKGKVTLSRTFIGGQIAKVSVYKVYNVGVPIEVTVTDASGKVIHHELGNSLAFDWKPAKDTTYQIVVKNNHTIGVLVKVNTN